MTRPAYPTGWWMRDALSGQRFWCFPQARDVKDLLRLWWVWGYRAPLHIRMSDGSLIIVHAKGPWKVGDRAYLPQLKVSGVVHKVHEKGLGELKRDDGIIHGVRLSDLRRAPDGR